jgi:predicted transposase YdaD
MSNPFDATLKAMLSVSPVDWPRLFGHPAEEAEVIDADISTVSGAADTVIRVKAESDWIQHVEFQAGPDALKPRRINVYNSVLEDRHGCKVRSALILLARKANLKAYSGVYECRFDEDAEPYRVFRYDVIRLWELAPDRLLQGSISLLPLVPLTNVEPEQLPEVLLEMKDRITRESDEERSKEIWKATDILMNLRFEPKWIAHLLKGAFAMELKHSPFFQEMFDEGGARELRRLILSQGEFRFGPATEQIRQSIQDMTDLDELNRLGLRILSADSWDDLLQPPKKKPAKRKKSAT